MRAAARMAAVVAAALYLTALPFYRVLLFDDRALLYRDIFRHFLAGKAIWANSVRSGFGIPFWNHFSFGGMRFWAENVNSPLNPLNAIFLFFSPDNYPRAMSFYIWAHYVFIFLGGYLLCRQLKRTRVPALLFAMSLALSGVNLGAHNVTHSLASFAAAPWFLWLWLRVLDRGEVVYLWAASLALAWPIYGGDPQVAYVLCWIALVLLAARRGFSIFAKAKIYFGLALGAFLASAAQLLPTLELIMDSERKFTLLKREELLAFSFHPARLLETFWPQFFGNRFGPEPFWGEWFVNFLYRTPFIFSTYPGTLTLLLICSTMMLPWANLRRRSITGLWAAALLGLFLCFGIFSWLPVYDLFLRLVPLFGAFRYPERLLFWPFLFFWLIAVLAYPRIFLLRRRAKAWRSLSLLWGGACVVYLAAWICLQSGVLQLPPSGATAVGKGLLALIAYGAAYFSWAKGWLSRRRFPVVLLLLQMCELGLVQNRLVWDQSKHIADRARNPVARKILENIARDSERLERGGARRVDTFEFSPYRFLPGGMDHSTLSTFAGYEALAPNTASYFGIDDIGGYFTLVPEEKLKLWNGLREIRNFTVDYSRLLDLTATYYLPRRVGLQAPIVQENQNALPYVFLAKDIVFEPSLDASIRRLNSAGHDFRALTVLSPAAERPPLFGSNGTLKLGARTGREFHLELQGMSPQRQAVLVWNETHDRHWTARVNGARTTIFRANAWGMALFVEANERGTAQIRFSYENPLITLGLILTGAWGLAFAALILRSRATGRSGARFRLPPEEEARA